MAADLNQGSSGFVVRAKGAWWWAPIGGPVLKLPLEDLLDQLGRRRRWSSPRRRSMIALGDDESVEPVATVVGRVHSRRLEVIGAHGTLSLDQADVRLLDAVREPTTTRSLVNDCRERDAGERLATMVGAGLMLRAATPTPESPTGEADEPVDFPDPAAPGGAASPATDSAHAALDDRIPVYAIWHPSVGPLLSLGMLTASARLHDGGVLNERYEIRPQETAESFLADLERRSGPAVLLCSDYVFTIEENLEAARAGMALNPELIVIHGGPSSPKRANDVDTFLDEHGDVAHVLVRGEGEQAICELLSALAPTLPTIEVGSLTDIAGLTIADPSGGTPVRTADRERMAELDSLPSPYLTGEFDHIPPEQWVELPHFETNRGCPYGCTFCDWGSATQSRIRKFSLERLRAEFEWAMAKGLGGVYLCDANFGILPRDVEIAEALAALKQRYGTPHYVQFTPAKNTIRHLTRILDVLSDANIATSMSISLQTTDPDTLEVVGRKNISTDAYVGLAADLRRRGHALTGDLILGLPGQSYESYKADLQFMLDHEIMPRTFPIRVLPNAPMNDPEYRETHAIEIGEDGSVKSSATMPPEDRIRAWRLRKAEAIAERYGVLRHVMRYLQWDHGVPATGLLQAVLDVSDTSPRRYPSISWLFEHFDRFPAPPSGWHAFYDEVALLVQDRFGIGMSSGLRCVLAVQEHLMPVPGRALPETIRLSHDYVAYLEDATTELYSSGQAGLPPRPLEEYPPDQLTVSADPLGLCERGLEFVGVDVEVDDRADPVESDFYIGALAANELDSPLVRLLPRLAQEHDLVARKVASARARVGEDRPDVSRTVPVSIGARVVAGDDAVAPA